MEFLDSKPIAISLCLAMLGFAVVLKHRARSWTNPSVLYALFWSSATLMPVIGVPDLGVHSLAIGYILLTVIAFGAPVFLMNWEAPNAEVQKRRGQTNAVLSSNLILLMFLVVQSIPVLLIVANLRFQGFPVSAMFSDPLSLGCQYLGYRYSGAVKPYIFAQFGTIINYFAAALGGLIIVNRNSIFIGLIIFVACLMPSILNIVIYADKGTIFLTVAFFFGAVIVGRTMNGSTALLTRRTVLSAPLVVAAIALPITLGILNRGEGLCDDRTAQIIEKLGDVATSAAAFVGRTADSAVTYFSGFETPSTVPIGAQAPAEKAPGGSETAATSSATAVEVQVAPLAADDSQLKYNLRSYAFGHLYAFSDWFGHKIGLDSDVDYSNPASPTFGFWTFMAIGKVLNPNYFSTLPDGYFSEYFKRENILQTNIYTHYRGMINDFTVPGSIIFMFLFGVVSNYFYRNMLLGRSAVISQTYYVFFIGYLYTSYIISLLIWNSAYISMFGVALALFGTRLFELKLERGGSWRSMLESVSGKSGRGK